MTAHAGTTEVPDHSPETFALTIAAAILVNPFAGLQAGQDDASATAAPASDADTGLAEDAADAFLALPARPIDMGPEAPAAAEPGYYLYWYGEDDTTYWLSDQPIPDFNGMLVSGGAALYARFGVLGTYMDMDIALGYGGIRPIEQAGTLHLLDPADL